ncbi:hypothetical protein E2C01_050269 [Portunus trituberculatus]|uniref:Uncharacterized protein n=1 Tax=Portunus trituberculatus TaxID=210409 RepID=A0A5B7GFF8_PORTR|nr:hypothetical protein [Portunus trituberculatus]
MVRAVSPSAGSARTLLFSPGGASGGVCEKGSPSLRGCLMPTLSRNVQISRARRHRHQPMGG